MDLNDLIPADSGWVLYSASSINDNGQIVGNGMNPDGEQGHAYLYSDGAITDLGIFNARAINNNRQVTGLRGIDAVLWEDGETTTLGNLGGFIINVCCINDSGQVAGTSYIDQQASSYHAFLWDRNHGMLDLGPTGGHSFSEADGLNNEGQVVGWMLAETGGLRAFLYRSGVMQSLGTLGSGDVSVATGINDLGQAIGSSGPFGEADHAFLWTFGLQDLNDLVTPGSGWVFRRVNSINNNRQIVGGRLNNQQRAFLLTPTTP
jgi:probable HAF family extracellular repeat protein